MKTRLIRALAAGLVVSAFLAGGDLRAQALPNLSSARVVYNTRKATVKPEGELKIQIDQIDKEMAAALSVGRLGEYRRLLAKGTTLLAGRTWGAAEEFQASLAIRTDRLAVDSSGPYRVRLEQIFAPAIELSRPLTARASLRPRGASAAPPAPAGPPPAAPPIELGTFEGVARDLRESPLPLNLNLTTVTDGTYTLAVEILDQDRTIGTATLGIAVMKGLDSRLRVLEAAAAKAPADVQADLRYPGDFIRKINDGLVDLGQFNVGNELSAADAIAAGATAGKNPFTSRTGDFERHYLLQGAGEIMAYRVFVPAAYNASKPAPLVIALHGLGGTEDSMFDQYGRTIPALAEKHSFLVAAPMGFRTDGMYGAVLSASADSVVRKRAELSEQDVMEVVKRMREQYSVDESRIYLMGHSMGAIGTWALGAKYPDLWAALGPVSGTGSVTIVATMRHIPWFVVHGDADPTVNVSGSRNMVAEMKKLGGEVVYVEVPGGNHSNIAAPNYPAMFEFFAAHRRTTTTQPQR
jgi:poly(3-hydroxybutyrate) depolymerase